MGENFMKFRDFIISQVEYLEKNKYCKKHKLVHTGKYTYIIDLYSYLGKKEHAKKSILYIITQLQMDNDSWVFYPGRINQMNMSNNVIDTGAIVDTICRFLLHNKDLFSEEELKMVENAIDKVVETYLYASALNKPITNQRLWGLTGLASYYVYKRDEKIKKIVLDSISQAFEDMDEDGLFIYYPDAEKYGTPSSYAQATTYYQSRHTAFIFYVLDLCEIDRSVFQKQIDKSIEALIGLYKKDGYKDLSFECKRWYWMGKYEVASHSFDIFALYHSNHELKNIIINNSLFQLKRHVINGKFESNINFLKADFQCNYFWSAHAAWLTRISNIEKTWIDVNKLMLYEYNYFGKNVFHVINSKKEMHLNSFWGSKNISTGILINGLPKKYNKFFYRFLLKFSGNNQLFSIKETVNHAKYALRGKHFIEMIYRLYWLMIGLIVSFLPIYDLRHGKIVGKHFVENKIIFDIIPSTKYGRLLNNKLCRVKIDIT
jgi:hypothetical protein